MKLVSGFGAWLEYLRLKPIAKNASSHGDTKRINSNKSQLGQWHITLIKKLSTGALGVYVRRNIMHKCGNGSCDLVLYNWRT
jgi:hypothetical protein